MKRDHLSALVGEFGKKIGIEGLEFDEYGSCLLSFDDVLVGMSLVQKGAGVFLYSMVGEVSEARKADLFELLLDGQAFFKDTAGASLAVPKGSGRIMLQYRIPADGLDLTTLEATMDHFVRTAETWRGKVQDFHQAVPSRALETQPRNHAFFAPEKIV